VRAAVLLQIEIIREISRIRWRENNNTHVHHL
jgi:hypothetical protein